jgi:prophage regulatory protein
MSRSTKPPITATPPLLQPSDRIVRLREVLATLGLSRTAFYLGMKKGTYPRPVQLGKRPVGWRLSQIEAVLGSFPQKG